MPTRPVAGSTFTFEIDLVSQANTKLFQSNPTIAAGDFQRSINGAAFANLDNLPTVTPASSTQVQIVLSTSETTSAAAGGRIKVRGIDASGAEWCSISILLFVGATDLDSLATAAQATAIEVDTQDIQSRIPTALTSGRINANVGAIEANAITAAAIATNAIDDDALAADAVTAIQSGLSTVTTAQVNSEVDTALADYDAPTFAELDARTDAIDAALVVIDDFLDLEIAAIKAKTDNLPADPADDSDIDTQLATIAGFLDTEIAAVLAAVDTEVAAIKVVTDALTSAAATKLALSAGTIVTGAAIAGTLSTTAMTTNLTEATDDHYNGRIIIWTSGVLINQATDITDYNGTTKMLTYTAVTEAPTAADTFIIV